MNRYMKQQGSILIITLILIIIVTVLALSEINLTSTQTKIATNTTDAQISFQTAEAALNDGTDTLLAGTYPASSFANNSSGLYTLVNASSPIWNTINWNSTSSTIASFQGSSSKNATYIIEKLPSVVRPGQSVSAQVSVYRITAYGVGASGGAPVILQSTVQIQQ